MKLSALLALIAPLLALAGSNQPASAAWSASTPYGRAAAVSQSGSDLATLPLPSKGDPPATLVTATGTISPASTITCTLAISTSGTPVYRSTATGGCSTPANVRLYFTSSTGYYRYTASSQPSQEANYWWSDVAYVFCQDADNGNSVTLTDTLDPSHWSDGLGHSAADPAYTSAFYAAIENARQVGLGLGMGCYFDTGVGVTRSSAAATLHLLQFSIE